jgi:hypothetical protein
LEPDKGFPWLHLGWKRKLLVLQSYLIGGNWHFPPAEACIPFVEEMESALQVLGVFLVSSHSGREVLSITMSEFSLTGDEMKRRRKITFFVGMNVWSLKGFLDARITKEGSQR